MKVKVPKEYQMLPSWQQEKIQEYIKTIANECAIKQVNHEEAELQKVWIKMCVKILHDMGLINTDNFILFLGKWKGMYRSLGMITDAQEQRKWVDSNLSFLGKREFEILDTNLEKFENM